MSVYAGAFESDTADDVFFGQARNGTYDLALANYVNGRFIPGAVFQLLSTAGIDIKGIWTALQLLAITTIAIFSVVFVRQMALPLSHAETLIFSGIIAAFPYSVSLIANKNNAVNAIAAYAAVSVAICFHRKLGGWRRTGIPALFLFICVASYQTTIYYFVVFTLGNQIFHDVDRRSALVSLASGALACVVAFVAYFIVYRITVDWALLAMAQSENIELTAYYGNPRSQLNDLHGFLNASLLYIISVARVLFAPEPILPLALKGLAIILFLASYRSWTVRNATIEAPSAQETFAFKKRRIMIATLLAAAGSPIHLAIANKWLAPRVLAHVGAIWMTLMIAALVLGPAKWRRGGVLGIAIIFLGLSFSTYTVVHDGQRQNNRDMNLARKIVGELQRNPQFHPDLPVAVIGLLDAKSAYMADTWSYYNLNTSKFGNEWSKRVTLEAAAHRKFALPNAEFLQSATALCATETTNRLPYKAIVTGRGAVVCLK